MNNTYTAIIEQEDNWFVATCVENWVVSQWDSIETALSNLQEAVFWYNLVQNELWEIQNSSVVRFICTFNLKHA